ncbi:hypothetical protein FPOAC2_04377 [Fusarium poae]
MTSATTITTQPTTSRSIPFELQLDILGYLFTLGRENTSVNLSNFAAVSKSWQFIVERELFRSLTVNLKNLKEFTSYSKGRTHLVKHILLEIFLCKGKTFDAENSFDFNETCFTKAIQSFFNVLSQWDGHGITFELGLVSPIQARPASAATPQNHSMSVSPRKRSPDLLKKHMRVFELPDDIFFGGRWEDSESAWHSNATELLGLKPLKFQGRVPPLIPKVRCISKLLVRRRYFPNMAPSSLNVIMGALTCLEYVHVERWCFTDPGDMYYNYDFVLPPSTKDFSFYNEKDTPYHRRPTAVRMGADGANLLPVFRGNLENLAISFVFDAMYIFFSRHNIGYKILKTLALTSSRLLLNGHDWRDEMLCHAAEMAKEMPKLEILECWYYQTSYQRPPQGKSSRVAIFTYRRIDRRTSCISWKSTSSFMMSEKTQTLWKEVVDVEDANFSVEHLTLDPNLMSSVGAIHDHLALKERILHNTTWSQV